MRKLLTVMASMTMSAMLLAGCGSNTAAATAAETSAEAGAQAETQTEAETQTGAETQAGAGKSGSGLDKITMTYVTSPLNIPSIVDQDNKFFETAFAEDGISVAYAEITSGADQTQALASGDVQFLYAVGGSSIVLSAANDADIKILNMYSRSPKAFRMYTSDETLTTPESLKGKTIVGPAGTNLHELLAAYLATAGMTIDDVNFMNMTIPDSKTALASKNADVALLAGAAAYQADQEGYKLIADGEGLIEAIIAVAVTDKFYQENPDVIATFQSAEADIAKFMDEQNDEAIKEAAAALDLDEQAVRDMYEYYDFSTETKDSDIAGLQKTADFMLDVGMIDQAVDVSALFLK
ncbi:MAG: NrtA/SsuA/CpmA family ABC transporter substrate-binding protein [Lachnospiraceae bacterium]|nr:NrtA/SsuA/CpmA family ABC transporter substrate-binding protein [Lachnospiraceae bacterium]